MFVGVRSSPADPNGSSIRDEVCSLRTSALDEFASAFISHRYGLPLVPSQPVYEAGELPRCDPECASPAIRKRFTKAVTPFALAVHFDIRPRPAGQSQLYKLHGLGTSRGGAPEQKRKEQG